MKPIAECRTLQELFEDPTRWTQNSFARNTAGESCYWPSAQARSFCFIGGLKRIYGEEYWQSSNMNAKLKALQDDIENTYFTWWNDLPGRKVEQIQAMVKKHDL